MGARGPAAKPTKLKMMSGGRGRRINKHEPKPIQGLPRCPKWFKGEALDEWNEITEELSRLGMLTVVDGGALIAYCKAYADVNKLGEQLEAEGETIEQDVFARDSGEIVGTRTVVNPVAKRYDVACLKVKQFLSEFGLSPAARVRLKSENHDDHKETAELTAIQNQLRAV